MRHLRTLSRSLLSSISLGTIVLGCATNAPTESTLVDSDSAIHSESLAFTSSDGVACLVANNKPSLWFPLDSIDAVDLAIKVQQLTGKRIKPEEFKHVRKVGDVVATARQLMAD